MTSARELAIAYAAFLTAQLLGEERETIDFGLWLDEHWEDASGRRGDACLDDIDVQGTPHRAIEWIEEDGEIIGLLAGRYRGCFRVPVNAAPPPVALMLDDALACSTGSVHQERAHVADAETAEARRPAVTPQASLKPDDRRGPRLVEPPDRPVFAFQTRTAETSAAAG